MDCFAFMSVSVPPVVVDANGEPDYEAVKAVVDKVMVSHTNMVSARVLAYLQQVSYALE
jgi:hypothetical protein